MYIYIYIYIYMYTYIIHLGVGRLLKSINANIGYRTCETSRIFQAMC